jgi:maltose alpha-D-glucosyltransferase/alpha-amylase
VELADAGGAVTAIAIVQEFVRNQGDGWAFTLDHLDRMLDQLDLGPPGEPDEFADRHDAYWMMIEILGRRLAELHRAFAMDVDDPAFAPSPITEGAVAAWTDQLTALAAEARRAVDGALASANLDDQTRSACTRVLDGWQDLVRMCRIPAGALRATAETRIHGDLHLGQVVVVEADFFILDFEGEPLRSIETRRQKYSPLRDVAGMVRSFDYAGSAVLVRRGTAASPGGADSAQAIAAWRTVTTDRFLHAYRKATAGCRSVPEDGDDFNALLDVFILEKALYEVCYEASNRPDWLGIPLAGIIRLLDRPASPGHPPDRGP